MPSFPPLPRLLFMSCSSHVLSSWCASFSSLPRPVSFGQTFPLSLCHHFVVPSLHACLGAVPTMAQPAARWGRRHACNLAELSTSYTSGAAASDGLQLAADKSIVGPGQGKGCWTHRAHLMMQLSQCFWAPLTASTLCTLLELMHTMRMLEACMQQACNKHTGFKLPL